MTRAFYPAARCHHAYAMAIDFGMKFTKRNGFWSPDGLLGITGAGGYQIEVAEESMHLLEPNKHDLVDFGWIHPCGQSFHETTLLHTSFEAFLEQSTCDYNSHRIIQRNGRPFHWPELEP